MDVHVCVCDLSDLVRVGASNPCHVRQLFKVSELHDTKLDPSRFFAGDRCTGIWVAGRQCFTGHDDCIASCAQCGGSFRLVHCGVQCEDVEAWRSRARKTLSV